MGLAPAPFGPRCTPASQKECRVVIIQSIRPGRGPVGPVLWDLGLRSGGPLWALRVRVRVLGASPKTRIFSLGLHVHVAQGSAEVKVGSQTRVRCERDPAPSGRGAGGACASVC